MAKIIGFLLVFTFALFFFVVPSQAASSFGELEEKATAFVPDKEYFSKFMVELGDQMVIEARRIGQSPTEVPKATMIIREDYLNSLFNSSSSAGLKKVYASFSSGNVVSVWILPEVVSIPTMFKFNLDYLPDAPSGRLKIRLVDFRLGPVSWTPDFVKYIPFVAQGVLNPMLSSFESNSGLRIYDLRTQDGALIVNFGAKDLTPTYSDFANFVKEAESFRPQSVEQSWGKQPGILVSKAKALLQGRDKDDNLRLKIDQDALNSSLSSLGWGYVRVLPDGEVMARTDFKQVLLISRWKLSYTQESGPQLDLLNWQVGATPLPTEWFLMVKGIVTRAVETLISGSEKRLGLSVARVTSEKERVLVDLHIVDPAVLIKELEVTKF